MTEDVFNNGIDNASAETVIVFAQIQWFKRRDIARGIKAIAVFETPIEPFGIIRRCAGIGTSPIPQLIRHAEGFRPCENALRDLQIFGAVDFVPPEIVATRRGEL